MVKQTLKFRKWTLALATVVMIIQTTAYAAITAKIDRGQIAVNESFTLIFETDSAFAGNPDFSPLQKDFEIVNNSRSSNTQIINGNFNQSTTWTVILFPKSTGNITIPSISFDGDRSDPIQITVTESQQTDSAKQDEPVFIEVSAEPRNAYVQAQILFTVRLYYAANLNLANNASLSDLELNQADALVKKLGEDKSYETWRNNQRYNVYERQYAIFPQKSGVLITNPIQFNGQIIQRSNRGLFDMDPYFSSRGHMLRRLSEKVKLDITPVPVHYTNRNWLPATQLRLTETWAQEPPVFKVGEPITRSISISVEGLTSAQIPELSLSDPDGFKLYPDQPYLEDRTNDRGVTAIRQEKIAMIPTQAGSLTLPEIEVPWWNTQTKRAEIARIPARTINVEGVARHASTVPPATPVTPEAPISIPIDKATGVPPATTTVSPFWPWLCTLLAGGWLATLFWIWLKRHPSEKPQIHHKDEKLKPAIKALQQACKKNDPQAAKTALLQWAKIYWPEQTPASLGEIARHSATTFADALHDLNAYLYRHTTHTHAWHGEALWNGFQAQKNITEKKTQDLNNNLEPLHKIPH